MKPSLTRMVALPLSLALILLIGLFGSLANADQNQQAEQVYQQLLQQEWESAGNPDFDYLLGLAALKTGRPAEATLAFERVLAVNPSHLGALIDLGIAYRQLGDVDRARELFLEAEKNDPPPLVRELISAQLDNNRTPDSWESRVAGELTLGYDSNINNSTDQGSIFVPLFGASLILDPDNIEKDSTFARVGIDGDWQYALNEKRFVRIGLRGHKLLAAEHQQFATHAVSANLGIGQQNRDWFWELGVNAGNTWMDNSLHNRQRSLYLRLRDTRTPRKALDYSLRANQVRNQGALEINDANQYLASARLLLMPVGTSLVSSIGLLGGHEQAVNNRADGNRRILGASYSLQGRLKPGLDAYTAGSFTHSAYQDTNAAFLARRGDKQLQLKTGLVWELGADTTLRSELSLTKNQSNVPIYEYERLLGGLTFRREFK